MNEKLEFLGDSVLDLVVTDYIFRNYPHLKEGDLAKLRANLVNAGSLADVARRIGLGECILIGRGAELTGGRERSSILADTFEAVVGAIYIDQGIRAAKNFIMNQLKDMIKEQAAVGEYGDPKTRLQEVVMAEFNTVPGYKVVREYGPVHDRTFVVKVFIDGRVWGDGDGKSKKKAEIAAARQALARFEQEEAEREDLT